MGIRDYGDSGMDFSGRSVAHIHSPYLFVYTIQCNKYTVGAFIGKNNGHMTHVMEHSMFGGVTDIWQDSEDCIMFLLEHIPFSYDCISGMP